MTWKIASLEQQLELFADRTSTYAKRYPLGQTMNSNQLRLWLSSMAYVLLQAFRQNCLFQTSLAQATRGLILFQAIASACPYQDILATAYRRIQLLPAPG